MGILQPQQQQQQRALAAPPCFDGGRWKHRWMLEKLRNFPPALAAAEPACLRAPINTGVLVCCLAAGRSRSVFTKLCLFLGLQGSLGESGSRGEPNKKALQSLTPELLPQHICLFPATGAPLPALPFTEHWAGGSTNLCCSKWRSLNDTFVVFLFFSFLLCWDSSALSFLHFMAVRNRGECCCFWCEITALALLP